MISFTDMSQAGLLPSFFSERDPRSAREQLHENYAHGGGVNPFTGFQLVAGQRLKLQYPGDPPRHEVSRAQLRDETIVLFEASWVAIIQKDWSYIVTRCD